jgi:hypothetical protein
MMGKGGRTWILANEADLEVVMDLVSLIWVGAFSIIRDRLGSFAQLQLLDTLLHQSDSPLEEPVS